MAGRTQLLVGSVSRFAPVGFAVTIFGDVANGNFNLNDGATFLAVFNNDSVVHNISVTPVSGVDGLGAGPRTSPIPISPGPTQLLGPYPIQFYGTQLLWNVDSALVRVAAYSLLGP